MNGCVKIPTHSQKPSLTTQKNKFGTYSSKEMIPTGIVSISSVRQPQVMELNSFFESSQNFN